MIRTSKRLYDAYAQSPKGQTLQELRDFGAEASNRLPNFGREHGNGHDGRKAVELAHSEPGEWIGGVVGGWLGRTIGRTRGKGGELGGAIAGQYIGEKVGAGLGAIVRDPNPDAVAAGVLTPTERDYPGYWGYSGDDAVGGWRPDRPRHDNVAVQPNAPMPRRHMDAQAAAENPPEAYADRIAQDFGNEWRDAYAIYGQNPGFWKDAYQGDPNASKAGPKMAPLSRTSRLPATPANDVPPSERGFWDDRFPGRSSLREAQGRWRE